MNHKDHKMCPLLWKHICINTDGGMSPCCEISQFQEADLEQDLQSLYNTEKFQTMRSAMLHNQTNSYCEKICYSTEKQGIKSKRLVEIEKYEKYLPSVFSGNENKKVDLSEVVDVDIKPSNYCNSRCVMCNNSRSSQYANESKLHNAYKGPVLVGGWYENYRKQLEQLYPNLYSLKINGGETTVMPEFPLVLESLKDNDKLRLSLNINNTIDVTKYVDIFSTLKRVDIDCSVEGYGSNNEYIRYPANWKTIHENLQKINDIAGKNKNINASFCMTVMSLNYVSWPNDFYQLVTEFDNFDKKPFVYFITQPESLLIQGLPQEMLDKGYQNVLELKSKFPSIDDDIVTMYKQYSEKGQDEIITKKLIKYTKYIDKARKINIREYIPEFENALS